MTTQTRANIRNGRRQLYGVIRRDGRWMSTRTADEGRTTTTPTGAQIMAATRTQAQRDAEFRTQMRAARAVTNKVARQKRDAAMIATEKRANTATVQRIIAEQAEDERRKRVAAAMTVVRVLLASAR